MGGVRKRGWVMEVVAAENESSGGWAGVWHSRDRRESEKIRFV